VVDIDRLLPVSIEQEVDIRIDGLGHRGEGIGRHEGLAVFVPGAIPGELVRARITEVKKNYARGTCLEVIEPSPERVAENCAGQELCGGCQLVHVSYREQLRLKRERVVDALARIGGMTGVTVKPVLGMDNPRGYRNKAVFHVDVRGDRVALGFYREQSHVLVDMDSCQILPEDIVKVALGVGEALERLFRPEGTTAADGTASAKGGLLKVLLAPLKEVVIRKGFGTGELMVVLVSHSPGFPEMRELAAMITGRFPEVVSVAWQSKDGNGVIRTLAGRGYIREQISDLTFEISPASFFQVNPVQAGVLCRQVLEYAALQGRETVIDAYCGTGTISLFLAERARRVLGIEVVEAAVRDARKNAALNGANNVEFSVGLAERVLPDMAKQGIKADVVVLDPPRAGCDRRVLETVINMAPPKLIYVSCDPGTLARDLERLTGQGFQVEEVQPIDMFPHTAHVETVVLISRVDK